MRNRFLLFVVFCLLFAGGASAQQDSSAPVKWEFSAGKDGAASTLILHGKIKDGWRLYSTTMKDDLPNSRVVLDTPTKAAIGKIDEKGQLQVRKEPLFDNAETKTFEKEVELVVHLGQGAEGKLKGKVVYMAIYKDSVVGPTEVPFKYVVGANGELAAQSTELTESTAGVNQLKKSTIQLDDPVNKCGGTGTENSKGSGLLGIFFLGILGGLFGLIMPVYLPYDPADRLLFYQAVGQPEERNFQRLFIWFFYIHHLCADQRSVLFPQVK
jgi:hypothetical protein